jgi:cellobiose phosphorylase/cellobionic acid phosphorylase
MKFKHAGAEKGNGTGVNVSDSMVDRNVLTGPKRPQSNGAAGTAGLAEGNSRTKQIGASAELRQRSHGHFNEDGTEFIVTNPDVPRAIDNFLWNDACFSIVQHTGVGCLDYQPGDKEAIQLLTGIGRTCDFDVFGRDHLMSRLVYIRDNDTGKFWNLNWEPICAPTEKFECRQGLGYTILTNTTDGIEARFRIFVPPGNDPAELWDLNIKNCCAGVRHLSIFVYVQFQFAFKWGFNSYGDTVYREVHFNRDQNAVVATKHPFCKPHDFLTGFLASDQPIKTFDGSRDAFVGTYGTLTNPAAVQRGYCSNTPGSADATAGILQFDFVINPGEEKPLTLILGATDNESKIAFFRDRYFGHTDSFFEKLAAQNARMVAANKVKTPDPLFDQMVNVWIKQGASYGSRWCRWGWNGYRDIVQHGLGVSALNPPRTRGILLEALRHQFPNGLALRGWNPVDEKPYSDSALWLVFTLCAYLKETGDFFLLDEQVPYYGSDISASVLDHICAALDFLENNKGAHGLILIKFGDWNDSLTGVGKEGRGESVWLSIAYAEAMREMASLMAFLSRPAAQADYSRRRDAITNSINTHAWDGKWYRRCYDDDARPIGSHENRFARIFMEPQCWALIAGVADSERASQLIDSCDDLLLTELGYMLLSPPYTEFDSGIGRISSMEPGIAENGTIYTHLNIWMILGLLRIGKADKAYDIFKRITPCFPSEPTDPKRHASFLYANCYFGPHHKSHPFQQQFTWITGSYAWLNTVLINEWIGAKPEYAGLRLRPCLPTTWPEVSICRSWRGTTYDIKISNPHRVESGRVELVVDGKPHPGDLLPAFGDGRVHEVIVTMLPAAKSL